MKLILVLIAFSYFVVYIYADMASLLTANATIGIIIDKEYLGDDYQMIKDAIDKYFIFAKREILKHGGVKVQYFSWTNINVKRDFTAILSIASCVDTWNIYKAAVDENILFMSISESDCPRLPGNLAITVPLLENGEEFPQLLLDLRSANAYDWISAVILYDVTLERDMVTRVVTSLTGHSGTSSGVTATGMSLSVMKLENQTVEFQQRKAVTKVLSQLPKELGSNYLVIVSVQYVNAIMEVAKNLGLVNPYSQWLYVISDTTSVKYDMTTYANLLSEGDNIAFVYNVTTDNHDCKRGLQCHSEELLEAFTKTLENAILEEISVSNQVSEEEWEAIRPTKSERRDYLIQGVKTHLTTSGTCNNCTKWNLKAGDTWGKSFIVNSTKELIDVGSWRPSDGISFTDELFPHIKHKFRGRNLPLITYHVNIFLIHIPQNHILHSARNILNLTSHPSFTLNFTLYFRRIFKINCIEYLEIFDLKP